MTRYSAADFAASAAALRDLFPVGSTATTILLHTSSSGMSRDVDVIAVVDGLPRSVAHHVARVTGLPMGKRGGVRVGGAGMDMGLHVVYSMSRALYPDGHTCTGSDGSDGGVRCPSSDHSNDAQPLYAPTRHHSDGGYAVTQRWL